MDGEQILTIERNRKLGNFNNLCERHKRAYWVLADVITKMEDTAKIPLENGDELLLIYDALEYDYPELNLIWAYEKSKYSVRTWNRKKEMTVYMAYKGNQGEIKKKINEIEKKVKDIIEDSLEGKMWSDEEMTQQICKYLAKNYHYSTPIGKDEYPKYAYTLECLLKGDGVCAGMACALTYILRKLQIPVVTVIGDAAGGNGLGCHAWNIVQYADGTYRHIDVTWDMGKNKQFLEYRDLDDVAMRVRRHFWETSKYPCCV